MKEDLDTESIQQNQQGRLHVYTAVQCRSRKLRNYRLPDNIV